MHHAFSLGDTEHPIALSRAAHGYRLHLDGCSVPVKLHINDDDSAVLTVDGLSEPVHIAVQGDDVHVHLRGRNWTLRHGHPLTRLAQQLHGAEEDLMRAPMPGSIVRLEVAEGDEVSKGQTLLVMESMKMETTLSAPRDGTIAELAFAIGQPFERDAVLVRFAAADAAALSPDPSPASGRGE